MVRNNSTSKSTMEVTSHMQPNKVHNSTSGQIYIEKKVHLNKYI